MNNYKILAIIGEAGTGKDAIMKKVLKKNPNLHEIVSCTTRPPREKEKDGINYHFLTHEEFANKVLNNEMLEATVFNDWCYGTSYDSLDVNKVNIGVFNPAGIEALMEYKNIFIVCYYVRAADKQRLLRQLNREENPDVKEIIRRFSADNLDFSELQFHYNEIENNTLQDLDKNIEIINSACLRLQNLLDQERQSI